MGDAQVEMLERRLAVADKQMAMFKI